MSRTKRIRKQVADGGTAVVLWGMPQYHGRPDGRWPVEYAPRSRFDPSPWLATGTNTGMDADGFRFNGEEVEVIK